MHLDPHTLVVGASISAFLMAVVLLFQARSFPPGIRGLREWGIGLSLVFFAALFGSLRGIVPDFVSIVLGNLAVVTGIALVYVGLLRFNERGIPIRRLAALILLDLLAVVYFTHVEYNFQVRVAIVTGTTALFFSLSLVTLLRGRPGRSLRFSDAFTAFFFLAEALMSLARAALAIWFEPTQSDFLSTTWTQQIYLAGYFMGVLLMSVGLILVAHDRLKEELQYLASHDSLTGVFARRAFIDLAEREQARSQRSGQSMALLMVDMDHFKAINDSYGHQVGDQVLRRFAEIAQGCLRRQDIFGRYGGEEFMVLLPETERDMALAVAARICTTVATTPVMVRGRDGPIRISVCIGVAVGDDKTSLDRLIGLADEAMYRAKSAGRNRVEYAEVTEESVNDPAGIQAAAG